jgi:hypothetical protein
MSDDNPYRAPAAAVERIERRKRRPLGPISAGVVAIVLATVFLGGIGLLASIFAVGSWWAYRFWPRSAPPEDPGVRAYLLRLEESAPGEVNPAMSGKPSTDDLEGNVLGDIEL